METDHQHTNQVELNLSNVHFENWKQNTSMAGLLYRTHHSQHHNNAGMLLHSPSPPSWTILFMYWRLIAQSTTQGHPLLTKRKKKIQKSSLAYSNLIKRKKACWPVRISCKKKIVGRFESHLQKSRHACRGATLCVAGGVQEDHFLHPKKTQGLLAGVARYLPTPPPPPRCATRLKGIPWRFQPLLWPGQYSKIVWLVMMHHYTKFGCKRFKNSGDMEETVNFWGSDPASTLTLKIGTQTFRTELHVMMMHRHTELACIQFSGSEDILQTKVRQPETQADWQDSRIPIYPPNFVTRGLNKKLKK